MKKTVYIVTMLLLVAFVFQSCEDQEEVKVPNFDIAFNKTVKVGEPVVFTINNAPNFLSFFSGEYSHEIKNSDRFKAEGEFFLNFDTARHYMDGASKSDNAWSLLVSTDYTGSGTIADVKAATWTDISSKFTFATARTWNLTNSGNINITEYASDKPTYFAVKVYAQGKNSEGNRQGTFRIQSFDISLAVANETYSLGVTSLTSPGFKPVNVEGTHASNVTKDNWVNKGNLYEMAGDQANYTNEDWLITNPVNLSGAVAPDMGVPLKLYSDMLKTFEYIYTTPGTYNVAFVGNNQTINGKQGSVKEYTITVTD